MRQNAKMVTKVTKLSDEYYVRWINNRLNTTYKEVNEFKDCYIYIQLMRRLFPMHVDNRALSEPVPKN